MSKIYDYQGFKIQNLPYGNEPRWFIFDENMKQIKFISPCRTLKNAKKEIDDMIKRKF